MLCKNKSTLWIPVLVVAAGLLPSREDLGAQIVEVSGAVELLDPAPDDVQLGALESDHMLFAFDEKQSVLLREDLPIDSTTGDVVNPGVIDKGTVVNSHLIHADPRDAIDRVFFEEARIVFDSEILGFFFKNPPDRLRETDELLGLPGTLYEQVFHNRGAGNFPAFESVSIVDDIELVLRVNTNFVAMDNIRVITRGQEAGVKFLRGDCNGDGAVNLSDAQCALNWLFGGAEQPGCLDALDTNGDATVNIADPVSLLNFLFAGGPAPGRPFPECEVRQPALSCDNPPACM